MLFLSTDRLDFSQHSYYKGVAIELRLDLFSRIEIDPIRNFLERSPCPVMLTLRKVGSEALIEDLLSLEPPFFDLDWGMRGEFIRDMVKKYPKTKFVLSHHDFEKTPADLEKIYDSMRKVPAFSYKIAAMAHSTNDALRMLLFAKKNPKVSAICMGEKGQFARVLGPIVGNLVDYASAHLGEETAPGQLTVSELIDLYHYPSLNKETSIYGLIGDPVEKSPGHLYHNQTFLKRGFNGVYVKMNVKPGELSEFIPLAAAIGIRGLSVTIPLKEKILPFLDRIEGGAKEMGAVNTLLFKDQKIIGTNTDGIGALDAIEKKGLVCGKKVVLVGAGGVARAIAFEAKARGAEVLILNRTIQRAKELGAALGCQAGGLDEAPDEYDIIINCSPDPLPIDPKKMKPDRMAMDVVYFPRETDFLKEASLRNCQIVYGEEMFANQAASQTAFWMGA